MKLGTILASYRRKFNELIKQSEDNTNFIYNIMKGFTGVFQGGERS